MGGRERGNRKGRERKTINLSHREGKGRDEVNLYKEKTTSVKGTERASAHVFMAYSSLRDD